MRTAPHAARLYLEDHGYHTIHLASSRYPVDFIAWKGRDELLFIRALSPRGMKPKGVYEAHLQNLRSFVSTILCPGRIELWIANDSEWIRYHVMTGGFVARHGGIS